MLGRKLHSGSSKTKELVPVLCNCCHSTTDSVSCDRMVQRAYYLVPISRTPQELFGPFKVTGKSRTPRSQSCFIYILLRSREVPFTEDVSGVYTSPFLDTDKLKMVLRVPGHDSNRIVSSIAMVICLLKQTPTLWGISSNGRVPA